ncbi:MAG: DMT family transporter, partial [Betaproteobacteria bacterium]|nr:DMT family transporter [Betaproteobacteria bacterium]
MSPGTRRQFGVGIAQLFCALSVLSLLDVTGKKMIGIGVPVLMVGWFRYLSHLLLFCAVALPLRGRRLFLTQSLPRQATRGVLVALTTITFFSVLKRLPLAEATALNFLAPVMVLIASPWVLGEPLRWRHALGVLLGFGGMLIVIRPGGTLPLEGVLLGLLSAVILAAFQIATRRVAADDPITTNAYSGVFGTLVFTLALPWAGPWPNLEPLEWLLLFSTGASGALGHWLQIRAYRAAPASLLSP